MYHIDLWDNKHHENPTMLKYKSQQLINIYRDNDVNNKDCQDKKKGNGRIYCYLGKYTTNHFQLRCGNQILMTPSQSR